MPYSECCRVTAEDMDKEAGRTRREYQEAKKELAALKGKVRRLGERMQEIGKILANEPENLIFVHESHEPRFQSKLQQLPNTEEFVQVQHLLPLTNEIRDCILKVARLREEVTRLEGQDPETGESQQPGPPAGMVNTVRMFR
jgi:hypothetical protein